VAPRDETPPAAAPAGGGASDEELARRFAAGDAGAFDELLTRHRDALFRFTRWSLGAARDEAEDATQDVLVEIYRSLPRFEGRSRLRTWMFGLTRNVCRQRRRARRRSSSNPTQSVDSGEALRDLPDGRVDLDAALERREIQEAVGLAIEGLSPEHRSAVLLRDIEGLSYEEIAEVLGIPLGTVRSRLHNARLALAGRLFRLDGNRGKDDGMH
jgi:RNA polymerase sigma-70 factor, ECF subfamily